MHKNNLKQISKSVIVNGTGLLGVRITILITSMVITMFLARYLGPEDFGTYMAGSNIYFVFMGITLLGLGNVLTREVAKKPAEGSKYFFNIVFAGILLSLFGTIALILFNRIVQYPLEVQYTAILLAAGLFPHFLIAINESLYIGLEKVKYYTFVNLCVSVLEMILIIISLVRGYKIYTVVLVSVGIRYLFCLIITIITIRFIKWNKFRPDFKFIIKLFKVSIVFSLVGIISSLLFKLDMLFLTKIKGVYEAGLYSAAYKLINPWAMIISSFIGVLYPITSRLYQSATPDEFRKFCQRFSQIILLMALTAVLINLCLSKELVLLLFKSEFEKSVMIVNWLSILILPMCGTAYFGMILASVNLQRFDLIAIIVAFIFSLGLNFFLINAFGYYGCIAAVIVTFFIILAIQLYIVHKKIYHLEGVATFGKPFLIFTGVLMGWMLMKDVSGVIKMPLLLLLFAGCMLVFKLVRKNELKLIFQKDD